MKSWTRPQLPRLSGSGVIPRLYDTSSGELRDAAPGRPGDHGIASIYVCGITPYDATHLGHANTYLAYDTLIRLWLDAGFEVRYAQNVTDIDDPLLERATATGVDWRDLAEQQVQLFRGDMEQLRLIPPDHYVAVTDEIAAVSAAVERLLANGTAYRLANDDEQGCDSQSHDIYFDSLAAASAVWSLGTESRLDRATMLTLSAERGGDPERPGKRDALDPLLWKAAREGEPSWDSPLGAGRPGWHIECSVIAHDYLGTPVTVQGGGSDLIFPHHEFSAGHAAALTGQPLAQVYAHAGMVGYAGEKMSKSLGNLVLVSGLVASGTDPRALRIALLSHHYRSNWEWTDEQLTAAEDRLARWAAWALTAAVDAFDALDAAPSVLSDELRTVIAHDLDTPAALAAVDARVASGVPGTAGELDAIDALLGIRL